MKAFFPRAAAFLTILSAIAAIAGCAGAPLDFHLIAGGFARGEGPDGNSVIVEASDGLVVIDTGRHPGHSRAILDYAAQRRLPITTIVNTHWHLDHTTGNADIERAFPAVKVYATRAVEGALRGFLARGAAASERMLTEDAALSPDFRAELERGVATVRAPGPLLPDVAVDSAMSLEVAGRALDLYVTDHAVTASDIWIWDSATRTAIVGDLVTLPAPFLDTACTEGWLAAFKAIEDKPVERVIPGHGPAMTLDEFRLYRRAFENLLACAKEGADCGQRWVADAGPLLTDADRKVAPDYVAYYVENVLRSQEHRAAFCAP